MKLVAGVDIGNATTEVAIASVTDDHHVTFLASNLVNTTGIKGTRQNIHGVLDAIKQALDKMNRKMEELDLVRINEAAPVIGDVAMETITETIITESTMIGHNPTTPGGMGLGIGNTIDIVDLENANKEDDYIVLIGKTIDFNIAAEWINQALEKGLHINGAIAQKDDGVLINNRIKRKFQLLMKSVY